MYNMSNKLTELKLACKTAGLNQIGNKDKLICTLNAYEQTRATSIASMQAAASASSEPLLGEGIPKAAYVQRLQASAYPFSREQLCDVQVSRRWNLLG